MNLDKEKDCCDEEVFNTLFKTLSTKLYRFLYYKFGSETSPSDIVQEAFIKLWDNCKKVAPEKAKAYLFTVANNYTLNSLERKKVELNYNDGLVLPINNESPQYLAEADEFEHKLKKALEELPEKQRVAFMLNRIEKKKHKEIAEILGISQKAVEKRIYSAVLVLKDKLGNIKV